MALSSPVPLSTIYRPLSSGNGRAEKACSESVRRTAPNPPTIRSAAFAVNLPRDIISSRQHLPRYAPASSPVLRRDGSTADVPLTLPPSAHTHPPARSYLPSRRHRHFSATQRRIAR